MALRLMPSVNFSNTLTLMEYFKDQQLEDAISCLQKFASLQLEDAKDGAVNVPLLEYCAVHPQMKLDLFCKQCGVDICTECTKTNHERHGILAVSSDNMHEETQKLGKAINDVTELMKDMKKAIYKIKDVKQRVSNRKDDNINKTREVFATLHKAIDEREEQTIADIKEAAYKRERALEVRQLHACTHTYVCMYVHVTCTYTYMHFDTAMLHILYTLLH